MHSRIMKTVGLFLFIGLLMPAGMLLATESSPTTGPTTKTANLYDAEQASNLLNHMQTRALKVRKEVAVLQAEGDDLPWQVDSARLRRAKNDINTIGNDLMNLDQMRNRLEPWQQNLLSKITPALHEMVYQTDAALNTLNAHQNRASLLLFECPQNINQIYRNATHMANTIQTVTQHAQAEQKMTELNKGNRTTAGS